MRERTAHRLFQLGVIAKGVDGVLELLGGVTFLLMDPRALGGLVRFLTAHELSEDPSDLVANALRRAVLHVSLDTQLFASLYLLAHGVLKLALVSGLWHGRRWAYPAALWFLGAFVAYELYRSVLGPSPALAALTALDVIVMALIWREWRSRRV